MRALVALASAAPLSTFLRLRFDVQSAAVGGADDEHEPERGRRACRALCSAIATACDAAGIAVVAVPQRTDSLQVLCHKTVAARAYKTIVESNAQQQWRLVVSSIKQHASMLTNDDAQELSEAMDACLQITLQKAGWQRLSTCRYVKLMPAAGITTAPQAAVQAGSFLAAEPGTWQTLQHVTAGLQAEPPADLSLLMCDAGLARFCVLSPFPATLACAAAASAQPQSRWASVRERLQQALSTLTMRPTIMQHVYNRPCLVLPDMTPAYTKRLLLDTTEEAALRSYWLHTHQYTLPQEIPFFYEVSVSPDEEDAVHVVPCCCVWVFHRSAVDGLLPVAAQSPKDSAAGIMRCVVEDVTQSSFKFFGGSACSRKEHQPQKAVKEVAAGGGGALARPGVSQATQRQSQLAAASGWVTAACLPPAGELPTQAGEQPAKAPAGSGFASAAALTQHHTQAVGEEEELCDPFSHDEWDPEGEPGRAHGGARALASRPKQDVSREREAWQRLTAMLQGLRDEAAADAPPAPVAAVMAAVAPSTARRSLNLSSKPPAGAAAPAAATAASGPGGSAGGGTAAPPQLSAPNTKPVLKRKPGAGGPTTAGKAVGATGGTAAPKKPRTTAPKTAAAGVESALAAVAIDAVEEAGEAGPAEVEALKQPAPPPKAKAAPKPRRPAAEQAKVTAAGATAVASGPAGESAVSPAAATPVVAAAPRDDAGVGSSDAGAGAGAGAGAEAVVATAGAAAGAEAKGKPRPKAKDMDVEAVTAKVREKHGQGKLKDLTIPELQCFLRSRKQPVGGKKGDVEARVQALLGPGAPAPPPA